MNFLALPLHQRITNFLKEQIENQLLKPGSMLPSEKELCTQFGVSRITVRKSLSELRAQGLIHSIPGKGTFVSLPQIKAPLSPLSSFTSDMEKRSLKVQSQVLASRVILADIEIAEKFRVSPGTEIVQLDRLRMLSPDLIPVAIQKILLLHSRCPGILHFDFETEPLYHLLQNNYGLVFDRSETIVTARMSTAEETRLLGLKKSSALLQNFQTTFLATGEIIEVADSVFRPDLYSFEIVVDGGNTAFQG
jgi:GntR family transcriptional regulator